MLNGELNTENTPCLVAGLTLENVTTNGEFHLAKLSRENAMPDGEFNIKTRHAQWRVTLILNVFPKIEENETQCDLATLMRKGKSQS